MKFINRILILIDIILWLFAITIVSCCIPLMFLDFVIFGRNRIFKKTMIITDKLFDHISKLSKQIV